MNVIAERMWESTSSQSECVAAIITAALRLGPYPIGAYLSS
jgi:hypothetical protein